jgi:type III pantothenate kinase
VNVDVVVDAGNSFIKWGRCAGGKVVERVSLNHDDTEGWNRQLDNWCIAEKRLWAVSGSDPKRQEQIIDWLFNHGQQVKVLDSYDLLPLKLNVKRPEKVGLDRLFNAVAVNSRKQVGVAAVVIDAGTAVTVDYIDAAGVFQGGAILPGLGTMAESLHKQTALLPHVKPDELEFLGGTVKLPGKKTTEAMALGIIACFLGGIERISREYLSLATGQVAFFIGGGDGSWVDRNLSLGEHFWWPEMTLEGIRIAGMREVDEFELCSS